MAKGSIVILYTSGRIAVSKSRKVRGPPPLLYLHYKHYFSGTQVGALDKSMVQWKREWRTSRTNVVQWKKDVVEKKILKTKKLFFYIIYHWWVAWLTGWCTIKYKYFLSLLLFILFSFFIYSSKNNKLFFFFFFSSSWLLLSYYYYSFFLQVSSWLNYYTVINLSRRHLQQLLKFILFTTLDFTRRLNHHYQRKAASRLRVVKEFAGYKKQPKTVRCPWILLERKSRSHFGKS